MSEIEKTYFNPSWADKAVPADPVNQPPHYTHGAIETIDVIEDWQLGFHLGNCIKYISRAKHKGNEKLDIDKAIWYLQRYRDLLEK